MNLPQVELAHMVTEPRPIGVSKRERETCRVIVEAISGKHKAFVKCLSGRELVNELVVATLGRSFGFPIPEPFLIRARVDDFPNSATTQGLDASEGIYVFGSKDTGYPSFSRFFDDDEEAIEEVLRARKFRQWAETIIFDDWVANIDRHLDNLLLISETEVLWIDHAWSFTGKSWTAADFEPDVEYKNKLFDRMIAKIQLDDRVRLRHRAFELAQYFEALPVNQVLPCSMVVPFLDDNDSNALLDFIVARMVFLEEIMARRIGIPKLSLSQP